MAWLALACFACSTRGSSAPGTFRQSAGARSSSPATANGPAVRIGVDDAPPYSVLAPDGTPSGLAVDLIKGAARRLSISIRWVPFHRMPPDAALNDNLVDLWPVMSPTPDRLKRIHVTKPWFRNSYCLFTVGGTRIGNPEEARGRTVAYNNAPATTELARQYLGGADLRPEKGTEAVAEAVCGGAVDAGFIETRTLDAILTDRPAPCRSAVFKIHFVRKAFTFAGIGARKESQAVADAIYDEVQTMVTEDSFAVRVEQWSSAWDGEMQTLFAFEKTKERSRIFFWGFIAFFAASAVLAIAAMAAWRARRAAERARTIEAIRADMLRRLTRGDTQDEILSVLAVTFELAFQGLRCSIRTGTESAPPGSVASLPVLDAAGSRAGVVSVYGRKTKLSHDETEALERTAGLAAIVLDYRKLRAEMEYEATHDRLTRLANRWTFNDRLKELADGKVEAASLFFIDLDHFKQINDGFGHRVGDLYLQQAGERIRACFAPGHMVARIGGDEFTAIAADLSPTATADICQSIVDSFRPPFLIDGFEIFGSASVGVSSFPRDGSTAADIQGNADAALYAAKELGRNQYQAFAAGMRSRATAQIQMQRMILHALDAKLFELFYQPQVDAHGLLVGMEALIRMRHPELGLILPDEFIPVAESADLIGRVDSWVLSQACRQYSEWRDAGLHPQRIAVNFSRLNLAKTDTLRHVTESLRSCCIEPSAMQIEITESTAMLGGDSSMNTLRQFRQLGFSLALDDFGTGYSSLSCLHQLPVDSVKIDKSFVRDMKKGTNSEPLIEALIAAAKALGMGVTAEGVETEDQMRTLSRMGCDVFQGFYISKAVDARAATAILARNRIMATADAAD